MIPYFPHLRYFPFQDILDNLKNNNLKFFLIQYNHIFLSCHSKVFSNTVSGLTGLFEGGQNLKDRSRSLQLTFGNLTSKNIEYIDTYFDSGTWFKTWQPTIEPTFIQQGTVANKQGSFFTGVTGGFKLKIDNYYIYLGFNNPFIGSYKNYCEITDRNYPAKYGYDNSENNYPKKSTAGKYQITATQTDSSIAQMAIVYSIRELS